MPCKISSFFGEIAKVMTILNTLKVGNRLFTKQSFYTFKDEVRRTILPTLEFMVQQTDEEQTPERYLRLVNFKNLMALTLSCEKHEELFMFLKAQFSVGEFKDKTLAWLFALLDEVLGDLLTFADHLADELKVINLSRLVKPAIAQRLDDVLKCLKCVADQEMARRRILEQYGSQAMLLGGKVFSEFYQLYNDYSSDKKTFGRIMRETLIRENAYRQLVNLHLLALSKRDNEILVSDMKESREKGKGPAVEEMSDEEEEEEETMDYYGDEPSSKRSKLSDSSMGSDTGSTSMETGDE